MYMLRTSQDRSGFWLVLDCGFFFVMSSWLFYVFMDSVVQEMNARMLYLLCVNGDRFEIDTFLFKCCSYFVMGGLSCRACELSGSHAFDGIRIRTGFETLYHDMMLQFIQPYWQTQRGSCVDSSVSLVKYTKEVNCE